MVTRPTSGPATPTGGRGTLVALAGAALAVAAAILVPLVAPALADDTAPRDAAWYNRQQAALAALDPADGWRGLSGNLRWRRVAGDGSGPHPTVADTVTVHYRGSLVDGTVFDSSLDRGEPATFPLGRLIPGWQRTIPLLGVGDTAEIAVPADLAYGPRGKGPIPGGATLFFTIRLLGIESR